MGPDPSTWDQAGTMQDPRSQFQHAGPNGGWHEDDGQLCTIHLAQGTKTLSTAGLEYTSMQDKTAPYGKYIMEVSKIIRSPIITFSTVHI